MSESAEMRRSRAGGDRAAKGRRGRQSDSSRKEPLGAEEEIRNDEISQRHFELAVGATRADVVAAAALSADEALVGASLTHAAFFEDQQIQEFSDAVVALMSHAVVDILASFDAMLSDRDLWDRLAGLEAPRLSMASNARLRELVSQDLGVLLDHVGYKPPPEVAEWVDRIQSPLEAMIRAPGRDSKRRAADAENELRRLTWRLRRELEVLVRWMEEPDDEAQSQRTHILRDILRGALRASRSKLTPAALAAGAAAAVTAAAGEGSLASAALGASAVEALKVTVELTAVNVLAEKSDETLDHGPSVAFGVLAECFGLLDNLAPSKAEAIVFVTRRSLADLLTQADHLTPTARRELWAWTGEIDASLTRSDRRDRLRTLGALLPTMRDLFSESDPKR